MGSLSITPPAYAARIRVNVHRVLGWIASGELAAVNFGDGSRPRWRISPAAIEAFEARRAAKPRATTARRKKKQTAYTEYF